jgi:predicted GNAT superfamily acetyltransferase
MKSREVFQTLLQRKYRIIDFAVMEKESRKRDFYVLKKSPFNSENNTGKIG